MKAETLAWDFSCIDKYSEEEIRREIDAQWDWFVKSGQKPSGLVSQKGEHGDPKILLPFIEKAKKKTCRLELLSGSGKKIMRPNHTRMRKMYCTPKPCLLAFLTGREIWI